MKQLTNNDLYALSEFTKLNPFLFNKDGLINHDNLEIFEIKRLNECVNWNDLNDIFRNNSNSQVEIYINTKKALESGIKFYKSENNVILTRDDIHPDLFEKVVFIQKKTKTKSSKQK